MVGSSNHYEGADANAMKEIVGDDKMPSKSFGRGVQSVKAESKGILPTLSNCQGDIPMWCPRCKEKETKVIDSRVAKELVCIRRRRECVACGYRHNTRIPRCNPRRQ